MLYPSLTMELLIEGGIVQHRIITSAQSMWLNLNTAMKVPEEEEQRHRGLG